MSECKEFIVRVRNADLIAGSPFGTPYFHGEIVRCRDCRFYKCGDDGWWCLRSISTKSNHPDGFCAWGERE